jgi:hypothetical protein
MRPATFRLFIVATIAAFMVPAAPAEDPAGLQRAGNPQHVSRFAAPAFAPGFGGYYVGGSQARGGIPGNANQGTWGWDYVGRKLRRIVNLNWAAQKPEPSPREAERQLKRNGNGYKSDVPEVPAPPVLKRL